MTAVLNVTIKLGRDSKTKETGLQLIVFDLFLPRGCNAGVEVTTQLGKKEKRNMFVLIELIVSQFSFTFRFYLY
jgi:hypothetical protein